MYKQSRKQCGLEGVTQSTDNYLVSTYSLVIFSMNNYSNHDFTNGRCEVLGSDGGAESSNGDV